jgi:type IV secretory pathway VirB10-like protein
MEYPQLFDHQGRVRSDLKNEQSKIEALPDAHRVIFFACLEAVRATEAGQARVTTARLAVRDLEVAHTEAVEAYEKSHPIFVRQRDMIRAVSAAQQPGYVSPPPVDDGAREKELQKQVKDCTRAHTKLVNEEPIVSATEGNEPPDAKEVARKRAWQLELAKAASQLAGARAALKADPVMVKANMDGLNASLALAHADFTRALRELRSLELASGTAIEAWRHCLPIITQEDLKRDYIARGQAERAARVARGESAEPPRAEPNYQSAIDRIRGTGKRAVRPLIGS